MNSAIPYKLIPLKQYQDLVDNNCVQNQKQELGRVEKDLKGEAPRRTIAQIQEQNLAEFTKKSKNQDLDEVSQNQKYYGMGDSKSNLTWLYDNKNTLPKYSQQRKIEGNYDNYSEILYSKNIPDKLKLQILNYFRQKYDSSRNDREFFDDGSASDDSMSLYSHRTNSQSKQHYDYDAKIAIEHILSNVNSAKKTDIKDLSEKLLLLKDYIKWDKKGNLIKPVITGGHIKNLEQLVNILVYSKRGTKKEVMETLQIIKPFYKKIYKFIVNKKLQSHIETWNLYNKTSGPERKSKLTPSYQSFY